MADEIENFDEDDKVQDKKLKKTSKHDSHLSADLERVTDYAEEREIKSTDISNMAANVFITKREKENEERLAKERELQKVQVKKEDIELIIHEMEISRMLAEKTLREHGGNLVLALEALVN